MSAATRVLIVDDDPLVRSALSLMLGGTSSIDVVGEAADGRAGVELARTLSPDVVLMDIRMPVLDGLEASAAILAAPDAPHVIVLTTFDADDQVLGAVAAGADGFLLKDTPPAEIVAAIEKVAAGQAILSPTVTRTVLDRVRQAPAGDRALLARRRLARLTARERDVAEAVGRGLSNAEIAAELYLSVPTVKAHVSKLFEKLEVSNRVQIALFVHAAGQ